MLGRLANWNAIAGDTDEAIRCGEEALAMAEQLSLDEQRARGLAALGVAYSRLGDPRGVAHMERALELALSLNSPEAARLHNNLGLQRLDQRRRSA